MGSGNIPALIAAVAAIVAAVIAAWSVRASARDSERNTAQATAAALYPQLFENQRTDIKDLRERVSTLEATAIRLQNIIVTMRNRARLHMRWDEDLVAQVNHLQGVHVPPAPPLLEDDDYS